LVLMPLGTQLMREFGITPTQLGFFVSIYTVAASLSGFFLGTRHRPLRPQDRGARAVRLLRGDHGRVRFRAGLLGAARGSHRAGRFGGVVRRTSSRSSPTWSGEPTRPRIRRVMSAFSLASILAYDQLGAGAAFHLARSVCLPRRPLRQHSGRGLVCHPPVRAHLTGGRERNALAQLRRVFGEPNHLRIFAFRRRWCFSGFLCFRSWPLT